MTFLCRDEAEVCFQTIHNLALGRDEWLALHFGRFTLKKQPVPIVQEAEWTSVLVWAVRKISLTPGFDPRTA